MFAIQLDLNICNVKEISEVSEEKEQSIERIYYNINLGRSENKFLNFTYFLKISVIYAYILCFWRWH